MSGKDKPGRNLAGGIAKLLKESDSVTRSKVSRGSLLVDSLPPRPRSPTPDFGVQPPPRPRSPAPDFDISPPPPLVLPSPSGLLTNRLDSSSPSSSASSSNSTPRSSWEREIMTPTATSSPRSSRGGSESSLVVDILNTPRDSNDKVIETPASSGNSQGLPLVQTPDADPLTSAQDQSRETDILTPPESPSGSPLPKEKRRHSVGMGENSAGFFSLTPEQKPHSETFGFSSRPRQREFENKQTAASSRQETTQTEVQVEIEESSEARTELQRIQDEEQREARARAKLQRNTEEFMAARSRNAEQQEEANVLAKRFAVEREKFYAIHKKREFEKKEREFEKTVKELKETVVKLRAQFAKLSTEHPSTITDKFNYQADTLEKLQGVAVELDIPGKNIKKEFKELGVKLFMESTDDLELRAKKLKALGHRLEKLENIMKELAAYMAPKKAKEHKAERVDLQDETFADAVALVNIDSMDQDTQTDLTAGMNL